MLLNKGLRPVAQELGLGNVGFHTLRHACRSWLSSLGASMEHKKFAAPCEHLNNNGCVRLRASEDMRKANDDLVNS